MPSGMRYVISFNDHNHNSFLIILLISAQKIWDKMETLNHRISRLKIEKQFAWLMTITLVVMGFPLFKNALVFVLEKLYELFIQHGIER